MAESQPAGVRLALRTSANWLELDIRATRYGYVGVPQRPPGQFDLCINGQCLVQAVPSGATQISFDMQSGQTHQQVGDISTLRFSGLTKGDKTIEIWLPYNETIELFVSDPLTP